MVTIPLATDPTLDAIDSAIESRENAIPQRSYLGMSQLGDECKRKLWYSLRHAKAKDKKAKLIKAAEDGYAGEELMASRLRMVDGIVLETVDPNTGEQFEYSWFCGHVLGHTDGKIIGILQAPETWHIWENKQSKQKKYDAFLKAKEKHGDKEALLNWNETYYAQAQLMMHFSGFSRHYLTVSLPGGRETSSCRTNYNEKYALELLKKAERIIFSDDAPERISSNPDFYLCKYFCEYADICHEKAVPQLGCRTCLHSTPERNGSWSCAKMKETITDGIPCNGKHHLYLPDMLDGTPIDATEDSVTYADGRINTQGGKVE